MTTSWNFRIPGHIIMLCSLRVIKALLYARFEYPIAQSLTVESMFHMCCVHLMLSSSCLYSLLPLGVKSIAEPLWVWMVIALVSMVS
jgi:hypothetical protein